jgi:hypothetical protein
MKQNMKQKKEKRIAPILSTSEFLKMMLLEMIPIIQIVMQIVWIFGKCNENKKSFAKALLIWNLLWLLISFLTIIIFKETIAFYLNMLFSL